MYLQSTIRLFSGFVSLFLLVVFEPELNGQELNITVDQATSSNAPNQFLFDESLLTISESSLDIEGIDRTIRIPRADAFDLSDNNRFFGAIHLDGRLQVTLVDGRGEVLREVELEHYDPMDETLLIRLFNDGRFLTRDNVANFTFYSSNGSVDFNFSNSSGSGSGETVSRVVSDPYGQTVLLYIPRIDYGESEGSLARVVLEEERYSDVYASRERTITYADVSSNGQFITLVSEASGESDLVTVMDRYGYVLAEFESEMSELLGAVVTEEATHLTIWSSGRVQVYDLPGLERIGSASIQQSVIYASYHEQDSQIVLMSGRSGRDGRIESAELQMINIERRAIVRTSVDESISTLGEGRMDILRIEPNRYEIKGLNHTLRVTGRF